MRLEAAINIDLSGKRALVCGASQGIGAGIAQELAGLGCRVVALARSRDKLAQLVADLPGEGHTILAQDLSDRGELGRAVEALAAEAPVHILINNTAGPKPGPITEAEEASFVEGFANHILVGSLLVKLLLPGMKAAGYGRIINIISTSVKVPIPNLGVSNTIRGAMASWCKTLAAEVAPHGVTANNILPGFTQTPRLENLITAAAGRTGQTVTEVTKAWQGSVPARRFGEPREVGAAAAFLAAPAAAYINGINLPVDGGRTGCL